jgi:REase_DpnII-MboI
MRWRRLEEEPGQTPHNRLALQERVRQMLVIERLCSRFHLVAGQLQSRHDNRSTIHVQDDYDVEDLLRALLELEHDEIQPEISTPSYAGGRPRTAFLLRLERIVLVAKVVESHFGVEALEQQLAIDTQEHKQHPDCRTLVCFVYDPGRRLAKPHEIEDALSGERDGIKVRVLISPKGS